MKQRDDTGSTPQGASGGLIFSEWNTKTVERTIAAECVRLGYPFGWAWLYTHRNTLDSDYWFITLQPGGTTGEVGVHAPEGVNYYVDRMGKSDNTIATRINQLYRTLGVDPHTSLTGVAIPFRSPEWGRWGPDQPIPKSARDAARAFGIRLWSSALRTYAPEHIVSFGRDATDIFAELLGVAQQSPEVTRAEHGNYTIRRWRLDDGRVLAEFLHPSRFKIPLHKASAWVGGKETS